MADTTPGLADARALVRDHARSGRFDDAWALLAPLLRSGTETWAWTGARNVLAAGGRQGWAPATRRTARVGLLCTYTSDDLAEHLRVACLAFGVDAEIWAAPYGQLEQEVLTPASALRAFAPTHVLVAATTADLALPELAEDPDPLLDDAVRRWTALWTGVADLGARAVGHAFVVPDETPLGHLSLRLAGSRPSMVRALNDRLAAAAGADVLLVDCERLAARLGKPDWSDPRLWFTARQPVTFAALGMLAAETAAVIAADLGLAARCLVVDLDGTLWGGIVGEEGPEGVQVGEGPDGEAHAALQDYLRALKARGMVLAVASKNDDATAREPFERNPRMRLGLDDFAVFVADWRPKSEQIAEIAERLSLPLDAFVFCDDNPAECAEVAAALPAVETIPLTGSPSTFVARLAACPRLEVSALTQADADRGRSYAGLAKAREAQRGATSLEDFWTSLDMEAVIAPLAVPAGLDRAAQLVNKTNQFNLTLVRRTRDELLAVATGARVLCLTLKLRDRFADHGLVGLVLATPDPETPDVAEIDTLLMSCRVIGRTAEAHLLSHLARAAEQAGYRRLRGRYVAGPRNELVAELYPSLGFRAVGEDAWERDLQEAPLESRFIRDAA